VAAYRRAKKRTIARNPHGKDQGTIVAASDDTDRNTVNPCRFYDAVAIGFELVVSRLQSQTESPSRA
jgi:hypothetical protein